METMIIALIQLSVIDKHFKLIYFDSVCDNTNENIKIANLST